MRIIDLFRKRTPAATSPTSMNDSVFGEVERDKSAWMARTQFGPACREIDVGLVSGVGGPTQAQRDFYKRIENNYEDLNGQYRTFFLSQYGPLPDGTTVNQLFDSLQLQLIYLPDIAASPVVWEMTFISDLEDHVFVPRFTGMNFLDEGWDG